MNRSKSRTITQSVTKITRCSKSQTEHLKQSEGQAEEKREEKEESRYGKQRKTQTELASSQELKQMSVGEEGILNSSEEAIDSQPVSDNSATRPDPSSRGTKPSSPRGLASIARLVKLGRCKNVVVVAGAGISTASGIPDFRTPGTGLYSNLEKFNVPYPEAIFNIDFFSDNPQPFFSLAKALYPGQHRPNYIHYFIRMLHHKGLLLRMYTQNIDGLEKLCGIPDEKLVEAHGSFASASCHLCYTPYPAEEAKFAIMHDSVPTCSFCAATVKPDVVFFGEDLPRKYFLHRKDFPKTDLLIIMGTSLQIEPCASLVNSVRSTVPRLLLNRNAVGPFEKVPLRRGDHMELGDLADSVRRFAEMLGWSQDIEDMMAGEETKLQMLLSNTQSRAASDHDNRDETSRPANQEMASSNEETDSETDSKSSA